MKQHPVHKTYIPDAWDDISEIEIRAGNILIVYHQNGIRMTRRYNKED